MEPVTPGGTRELTPIKSNKSQGAALTKTMSGAVGGWNKAEQSGTQRNRTGKSRAASVVYLKNMNGT